MAPLVSVLIPTLNRPRYLRQALESAIKQTEGNIEILVGDDGHAGESVCAEFCDPRIHYTSNRQRLGIAKNWEALLNRGRGDFLALLMDDDRLEPTFVEECLEATKDLPTTDVVFANHWFEDESSGQRVVRECRLAPGRYTNFAEVFMRHRPVAVSAALVRTEAWHMIGTLPETAAADMYLFGTLCDRGFSFAYIDRPLMIYRTHGKQLSADRDFRRQAVTAWEALRFSDPKVDRLRREVLAEALLSQARMELQTGNLTAARELSARARSDAPNPLEPRSIQLMASVPYLARFAVMVHRSRAFFTQSAAGLRKRASTPQPCGRKADC